MADRQYKIYPLVGRPGIQRDGTQLSSDKYIDGEHCRWYRGLPQKMGGFKQITNTDSTEIIRGMAVIPVSPNFQVYFGARSYLKYALIDTTGTQQGGIVDRTPTLEYHASSNNMWSFATFYSQTDNKNLLLAIAPPNLPSISRDVTCPLYYGFIGDGVTDPLLTSTLIRASGGIVILHPYLFYFGTGGLISWSEASQPLVPFSSFVAASDKIVAGAPTRGGTNSPAGIFWSLSRVIRATFDGNSLTGLFTFDTISDQSSILSSQSIVEYDGRFFWPGAKRFLTYNGLVQELPNSDSLQYFYSNLDNTNAQKVWGTKVPQWGEIWWHFPNKNKEPKNGECNDTIIYNIRENEWYDTRITRSSGVFDGTFSFPIWADNTPDVNNRYPIYMQETGVNKVVDQEVTPLKSYFTLPYMGWVTKGPNGQYNDLDQMIYVNRIEPDLNQVGRMSVRIDARAYARAPVQSTDRTWDSYTDVTWDELTDFTWDQWGTNTFTPQTEKINFLFQGREMNITFTSFEIDGDYEFGQTLISADIGDRRP